MSNFLRSKLFIGLVFFCLGFLANQILANLQVRHSEITATNPRDRFAVNPDDFDHDKMLDAMNRLQQDMMKEAGPVIAGVNRREDDKYVYYEIPLNARELNRELKVSVKDGMVSISENTKNAQSEREFSIEPGLNEAQAEVLNLKDKISIKIPKIKKI